MKREDICVVTITLARDAQEERTLLSALEKLTALGLPLVIADGGSSARFVKRVLDFNYFVVTPKAKGLVKQLKAGIAVALRQFQDKRAVLYTEPDKYPFFEGNLLEFVKAAKYTEKLGVVAAARDAKSFSTFPQGQFKCESFMNEAFSWIAKPKGDYCYGPLLLSRDAAKIALQAPDDLGWGWRFWTMKKAHEAGLRLSTIEMHLPCPIEQRGEDSPKDRMYRLKQLKQNLEALL
jgi:hypothetical protein